jgi:hypothetical protein
MTVCATGVVRHLSPTFRHHSQQIRVCEEDWLHGKMMDKVTNHVATENVQKVRISHSLSAPSSAHSNDDDA